MTAGRCVNSQSVSWGTPKKLVESVKAVLNSITLDPCSNEWSIVDADVRYILPVDGLTETWDYATVFVNPPYGRDKERGTTIKDWIRKCAEASLKGSEVVALIPVATNTTHWKDIIFKTATSICFLSDSRVKFLENGVEGGKGSPMACCVVYWGSNISGFSEEFKQHGFIMEINK